MRLSAYVARAGAGSRRKAAWGFFALITGAVAQKFIATEIHDDVVDVEAQIVTSELAVRDDVVRELRAISARLQQLERAIQQL